MTDAADFEDCNMVRRIDAGEALEELDKEQFKPPEGGVRRRFRACKDGKEGWITTHGSQGTVYAKIATRHYIIQSAAPVHAGLSAESAVVRVLMPGEAFQAFEEPKEVCGGEALTFYKVRAFADGAEGWVTSGLEKEIADWTSKFKVLRTLPLTRTLAANEAAEIQEVVRYLEADEIVDLAEHPLNDTSTGQLRARITAVSDQASGWATVRGEGSSVALLYMQPATEEERKEAETAAKLSAAGAAAPSSPPLETRAPTARAAAPISSRGVKREFSAYQPPMRVKQEIDRIQSTAGRPAQAWYGKGGKGQAPPMKRYKGSGKW